MIRFYLQGKKGLKGEQGHKVTSSLSLIFFHHKAENMLDWHGVCMHTSVAGTFYLFIFSYFY